MNTLGKDRAQVCIGMQQERCSLLEFFVGLAQFPGGFLLLAQRLTALFQGELKAIYHTQPTDSIEQQQREKSCQCIEDRERPAGFTVQPTMDGGQTKTSPHT